ncbi:MAG: diguanylate cyclase [Thiotrichales bacterium]|jgi:GGDEF domain-containing protein|nr:diguanylate cyclase [Thiotrichales bacterium]
MASDFIDLDHLKPLNDQYGHKAGDSLLIDVVHFCSASIGVALFNHDENNKERVMQRADAAMYQAKANGRNQIVISDSL